MSKYNSPKAVAPQPNTVNAAGGQAYKLDPKQELAELILTTNVTKMAYQSEDDIVKRLDSLLKQVDPLFAAKAAVYTRHVEGKRTVTHVMASQLGQLVSGQPWGKDFYEAIVRRPDDMLEIVAHYFRNGRKPLPNALKKGFAAAFSKFGSYQLAKYKKEKAQISLKDLECLVHPTPTEKNSEALKKLLDGSLKNTDTWEAQLSEAGVEAEGDEEVKEEKKAQVWKNLVEDKSLGYLALIRNLRNVLQSADDATVDALVDQITDAAAIKKSLVYPVQIYVAYCEISKLGSTQKNRKILGALDTALNLSVDNVPAMDNTVVLIDQSGSMDQALSDNGAARVRDVAHVFAAAMMKRSNVDVIVFASNARAFSYSPTSSVMDIVQQLNSRFLNGGTSLETAFREIKGHQYKRVVVLSDMQVWDGRAGGVLYKSLGYTPYLYSINLQGHGSATFDPGNRKVSMIAGWSSELFNLMKTVEIDPAVLIKTIEAIDFTRFKARI